MEGAKQPESAEQSAGGRGQAARRVSISEESADQPGVSNQPGMARNLVFTKQAEGCQIVVKAL